MYPPGAAFTATSGREFCEVTTGPYAPYLYPYSCVTDGIGSHGNNENCEMVVNDNAILYGVEYNVELNYDYITLAGNILYSAASWPATGIYAPAGTLMQWRADFSITQGGFVICAIPFSPPPPEFSSGSGEVASGERGEER